MKLCSIDVRLVIVMVVSRFRLVECVIEVVVVVVKVVNNILFFRLRLMMLVCFDSMFVIVYSSSGVLMCRVDVMIEVIRILFISGFF